jgi:hypothetical protein
LRLVPLLFLLLAYEGCCSFIAMAYAMANIGAYSAGIKRKKDGHERSCLAADPSRDPSFDVLIVNRVTRGLREKFSLGV